MKKLIDKIKRNDKSDMLGLLLDFPDQLRIAEEIGARFRVPKKKIKPKSILWCGMGGSAIGGDLIASYLKDKLKIPMVINRHYNIPSFVDKNTLVIISSYSGNTEETISCYKQARIKKAPLLIMSSNGTLVDMAIKNNHSLIVIPQGMPPRCALGYSGIPILVALSKMGIVGLKMKEIDEAAGILQRLKQNLKPEAPKSGNISMKLARALQGKIPVMYASADHFEPVAYRWRTQIGENAKMFSSHHLIAEMNHNDIEAFEPFSKISKNIVVMMLKDKADHPQIKKRIKITKNIIRNKGIRVIEINSRGKGILARMLSVIYIGDWMSFYLAVLSGIDPTPVDRISYLKKKLVRE